MRHIKEFKLCNEAKMFDNYQDLIEHSDSYLNKIYIEKSSEWKSKLSSILSSDGSYRSMAYSLISLKDEVAKDLKILNDFHEDIRSHIKEFDEIYQKSQQLSPEDDESYEELDAIGDKVNTYIDYVEQYIDDLESLSDSLINVDEKISYLLKLNFKSFY